MLEKTIDSIRTDLVSAYLQRLPQLDLTEGTPERDLFIEAPIAGILYYLYQSLTYMYKLHAPFIYYNELDEADVDEFCENYGVTPYEPTKSTGLVVFYTYTEPTQDIVIPEGTLVSTGGAEPLQFRVIATYTLYAATKTAFFNSSTNRWEIQALVESLGAGPEYSAGSNTVTQITGSISGIDGCINTAPITGGSYGESVSSKLNRVREKFQGRNLGTQAGLISFVKQFSKSVIVVPSGHPLMVRDGGFGGCTDIYVYGETSEPYTEELQITTLGLNDPTNLQYTSTSIRFSKQPVLSIISCLVDGVPLPPTYYTLQKDTGILANSTKGFDKLVLTSEGQTNFGTFLSGQTVTLLYIYNKLLNDIQQALEAEENYYINRDYLVFGFTKVQINVQLSLALRKGYDFNSYKSSLELIIANVIDENALSGSIEKSDIVTAVGKDSGVDNINLASCVLTPVGGGTLTAFGDILLSSKEYAVTGTITLTEWV